MNRWIRNAAIIITALAIIGLPDPSNAETRDETVQRLRERNKAERYQVPVEGHSIKAGGARILVNAPIATVRSVVQDYGNYETFMPRFKRSRIVDKNDTATQVYLQVPILHGAANVWSVVQFGQPAKRADGSEVIRGRMVESNVKDFRATWHLVPIDDRTTLLSAEILIVPSLPVPNSVVTGELEYASDMAVTSTAKRAEAQARAGK
ncbi:MAG: SRPBCC family protein [Polyangiaceae bacterium]|nr:SRPBCC family protein [Polyangiaceae bacterium]